MSPLVNILIRTSNRPALFPRCYESIQQQTYKHTHVIVGYDSDNALEYIPRGVDKVPVSANKGIPFYYDLYCNQLKKYVDEGWFMFLDDDDFFHSPTVLQDISAHMNGEHEAIICQFLRKGTPKPATPRIEKKQIIEGKIGLPCLILHSKHKGLSGLDGYAGGDYRYILSVSERVKTLFVPMVVVETDRRSKGKNFG
jgi:glycosyltransferase involved in cell wall biosynthesis